MSERYEIKGRLGRGGIGAVYQALDTHLQRDVAIKRLLPREETQLNDSASVTLESEVAGRNGAKNDKDKLEFWQSL